MDPNDLSPAEIASLMGADDCPLIEQPGFRRSISDTYRELANKLGKALSNLLASDVSVARPTVAKLTYAELVLRASDARCLWRAETVPDLGPLFLDMNPALLGLMVDRMLGDRRRCGTEPFQLVTEIEQRLAAEACRQLGDAFCDLWSEIVPVKLVALQREVDLMRSRRMAAEDSLTLLRYPLKLDLRTQSLSWIFPEPWPLRAVQQAVAPYCPVNTRFAWSGVSRDHPATEAEHDLVAELAETEMKTDELRDLRVGDVLQTDQDIGQPLTVRLDGVPRFLANLGKVDDRKAIEIVEVLPRQEANGPHAEPPGPIEPSPVDRDA